VNEAEKVETINIMDELTSSIFQITAMESNVREFM
jgi:hypothetical protein